MDYRAPLRIQLGELLRDRIEEGEFGYGELIPSERDLATTYGLNRMTVRSAISDLVREGYLRKAQGRGTFVVYPKMERDLTTLQGFTTTMREKGVVPSTRIIYKQTRKADYKFSKLFGISPDDAVYHIVRLRLGNEEPIALEYTYLPLGSMEWVESIDLNVISLYDAYENYGIHLAEAQQTLALAKAGRETARFLNIREQAMVFLFQYITKDTSGRVIEYTKSFIRGDKSRFNTYLKA
jgi:GntR family transcriptional regulator